MLLSKSKEKELQGGVKGGSYCQESTKWDYNGMNLFILPLGCDVVIAVSDLERTEQNLSK